MFYTPQTGDTRYKRKFVLFPINIDGIRYAWQFIYVKQHYGVCCWHDDIIVDKETYLNWKRGNVNENH